MCKCIYPDCNDGHYPLHMSDDGDVDWGSCPECVVNGIHICELKEKNKCQDLKK